MWRLRLCVALRQYRCGLASHAPVQGRRTVQLWEHHSVSVNPALTGSRIRPSRFFNARLENLYHHKKQHIERSRKKIHFWRKRQIKPDNDHRSIETCYGKWNFPVPSVASSVGRFVCHHFLKGFGGSGHPVANVSHCSLYQVHNDLGSNSVCFCFLSYIIKH